MTQASAAQALTVTVFGRVELVTKKTGPQGDLFLTLLKTPAPDQFSSPGTFEVRSKKRIGAEGSEVTVACELRGYSRSYENKNGDTVRTAEAVLQAL